MIGRYGTRYHDWAVPLSYGGKLTIVEGDRDIGKSYGMLRRALWRCLHRKKSMVWLRRTDVEAKALLQEFGGAKWTRAADSVGIKMEDLYRKGDSVFLKTKEGSRRVLRYGCSSGWSEFRDTDDPDIELLYLDEAFTTVERHRRYVGNEVEHALDIWKSMERDGVGVPMVVAGNKEKCVNIWLDYFGIDKVPKGAGIYRIGTSKNTTVDMGASGTLEVPEIVYERYVSNKRTSFDRLVGGTEYGAFLDGFGKNSTQLIKEVPRRSRIYAAIDFGKYVSLWLTPDNYIVASLRRVAGKTLRIDPDGSKNTVLLTPAIRKNFVLFRERWNAGRVRFDSQECAEYALPQFKYLL